MRDGADLDVRFLAFSLDQAHVEEGEPPVWEREPERVGHRRDWRCSTASRCATRFPEQFLDAHVELFAPRHDHGLKLGHEDVLRGGDRAGRARRRRGGGRGRGAGGR